MPMKVGSVEEIVALNLLLLRRLKIPRRRKLLEGRRLLALLLRAERELFAPLVLSWHHNGLHVHR